MLLLGGLGIRVVLALLLLVGLALTSLGLSLLLLVGLLALVFLFLLLLLFLLGLGDLNILHLRVALITINVIKLGQNCIHGGFLLLVSVNSLDREMKFEHTIATSFLVGAAPEA